MSDEHSPIRALKQRWDEKDAARDKQEERTQQAFLEAEANHTFAPIEDFLIRLSKVLSASQVRRRRSIPHGSTLASENYVA